MDLPAMWTRAASEPRWPKAAPRELSRQVVCGHRDEGDDPQIADRRVLADRCSTGGVLRPPIEKRAAGRAYASR